MKGNPWFRIGHLKILDHLILGLAALGLEKEDPHHVSGRVEISPASSWTHLKEELTEGRTNGAFLPAPMAMDLFNKGLDIRLLMFVHRAGSLIVKHTHQDIKTISDFKGRTLLVPSRLSIQTMLLDRMLSAAGLSLGPMKKTNQKLRQGDVGFEAVPPAIMSDMLEQDSDGDIAGYAVAEPFARLSLITGSAQLLCTTASLWKNHPCCVFVLKQSVLNADMDAAAKLISLFIDTAEKITPDLNGTLMASAQAFLGQPPDMIRECLAHSGICFDPQLLMPDREALETIQSYMADTMGVLNEKADLSALIDPSIISTALSGNDL